MNKKILINYLNNPEVKNLFTNHEFVKIFLKSFLVPKRSAEKILKYVNISLIYKIHFYL